VGIIINHDPGSLVNNHYNGQNEFFLLRAQFERYYFLKRFLRQETRFQGAYTSRWGSFYLDGQQWKWSEAREAVDMMGLEAPKIS